MHTRQMRIALACAVVALLLGTRPSVRAAEEANPSSCCFANPQYSGLCEVQASGTETCGSILDYLNSANSSGKSYCSNTEIRQGWTLAKCQ